MKMQHIKIYNTLPCFKLYDRLWFILFSILISYLI